MTASAGCQLIGRWQIFEADIWDHDYLDLVEPAYLKIGKNGRGEFAFGVVNATMELNTAAASCSSDGAGSTKATRSPARDGPTSRTMAPLKSSYPSTLATTRSSRHGASELFNSLLRPFDPRQISRAST
jgi:hypothetical protein